MKFFLLFAFLGFCCNEAYAAPPNYDAMPPNFDFLEILIQGSVPVISGSGLSEINTVRGVNYGSLSMFDGWAKCNQTANSPFTGTIGKRSYPYAPNVCNAYNKSVTAAYIFYRVFTFMEPYFQESMSGLLQVFGMDPSETSTDINTDYGLGNWIGYYIQNFTLYDGTNQDGGLSSQNTPQTYNRQRYSDYTSHFPENTAYEFRDKNRWQPVLQQNVSSQRYYIQQYLMPHARYAWNPAIQSIKNFADNFPRPYAKYIGNGNSHSAQQTAWNAQNAYMVNLSYYLDDYHKIEAELFDDKLRSVQTVYNIVSTATPGYVSGQIPWTFDDKMVYLPMIDPPSYAGALGAWAVKYSVDSHRPRSGIHFQYDGEPIQAWGGPYKGQVTILGNEWESYIETHSHSEYPSGTSCFCKAFAEANKFFFKNNSLSTPITYFSVKGSSKIEPGLTPQNDLTIGPYNTWDDLAEKCGYSRAWAGIHYPSSIASALDNCGPLGLTTAEFVMGYINGTRTKLFDPMERDQY
jgi:hypothetical protein